MLRKKASLFSFRHAFEILSTDEILESLLVKRHIISQRRTHHRFFLLVGALGGARKTGKVGVDGANIERLVGVTFLDEDNSHLVDHFVDYPELGRDTNSVDVVEFGGMDQIVGVVHGLFG